MSSFLDFNPVYLVYILVAASAIFLVEAAYLLFFGSAGYRTNINRRLELMQDKVDGASILVQLRRERGLTSGGDYSMSVESLNRLVLQSGLTLGIRKLAIFAGIAALVAFAVVLIVQGSVVESLGAALLSGTALPYFVLHMLRSRRQKKFGTQFPDAIDIIVRSLRAGHPVPIAITMVARELPDPCGSEFGLVVDEITYGADLETAMRNLYYRVGQDDLPLFVTAVAIQTSTGGNLGEILQNLSSVIRQRFKMRRKIRALAAEGRASALILSSLPILMFLIINVVTPNFYASVWDKEITKIGLMLAGGWMAVGNFVMYRMVNFKI